jgi:serine/threonine-protein kinase
MSGCPSREQFELYLDERLPSDQSAWMEGHVSACRDCRQALEEIAGQCDGVHLELLRAGRAGPEPEPKGELLRRIENAGWRGGSRSDVIAAPIGACVSPETPMPAESDEFRAAKKPTGFSVILGSSEPDPLILQPGTLVGSYRILEPLGTGGMGQVYKAIHQTMERTVALKIIAPHLLREPRARTRFQQEVRTAAKLHHPNIVLAHDAAEADGMSFLVMEYVEGTTLSTLVGEQGLPPVPLACEIVRQAAMGLQHALDKGMVHRDIKPGNLMVSAQHTPGSGVFVHPERRGPNLPGWPTAPFVKILDFGVARLREFGPDGEPLKMQTLTQEGCVVGTPEFMAPEQACDSRNVDIRSDIYSLGCTLYYLLTGRPPFVGTTPMETMAQHLKQPLLPVDQVRPGLPPGLAAIVHKMLAKNPDARWRTPAELAEALRPWIGEFNSSVAPDVRLEQRGLSATSAAAPGARAAAQLSGGANGPPARPMAALPPQPAGSKLSTWLALFLLFAVSMGAFLTIMKLFGPEDASVGDDQPRADVVNMRMQRVPFHLSLSPKAPDVPLAYDLKVASTEVTIRQFSVFAKETKLQWMRVGQDNDDLPVTGVTWEEATKFCNWLSSRENKALCYEWTDGGVKCRFGKDGYRLPTEAEWEFAARAGSHKLLPAEGMALLDFAWLREISDGGAHTVATRLPNSYGIHDMWGNVWEWCWDLYTDKSKDGIGPATGTLRTVWGGGWNETSEQLKQKPHKGLLPATRASDVGFRVVYTISGD